MSNEQRIKSIEMESILKILIWLMVFAGTNVSAQTKTKYETSVISTGHPSLTAEIRKNGSAMEVWVKNNHQTKTYKVNFAANVRLGGVKGEITKTLSAVVTLVPNDDDFAIAQIGEADPSKNMYWSLLGGTFGNFTWSEVSDTKNTAVETAVKPSKVNTSKVANGGSETVENNHTTGSQHKEVADRQNRHKTFLEQQEEQKKAKEKANYEKAVAYEQERQESIKQSNETISAVTTVITDYIYQQAEEKRKAREEEEEKLAREYEQRMEEHERKVAAEMKISNRKTAIAEFPAKDIPLGSQEKAEKIYYFIYAYDSSINNETGAIVYVSNVFEVCKYNDGTRVYTATIRNEIANLTPFAEVLHGYYYTQQEAEEFRQTFLSILENNGVEIKAVSYKGKPATQSSTTRQEDFWGEKKNDQNLAPAKIDTAKSSQLPREEQKKKKDYWD